MEISDEPAVPGERSHLQDDLTFCFFHDDGSKKTMVGEATANAQQNRKGNTQPLSVSWFVFVPQSLEDAVSVVP